jgi:hypothetical protein
VVVDRKVAWVASGIEAFLQLASAVRIVAEGGRLAAVRHREVDHRVEVAHTWAVALEAAAGSHRTLEVVLHRNHQVEQEDNPHHCSRRHHFHQDQHCILF